MVWYHSFFFFVYCDRLSCVHKYSQSVRANLNLPRAPTAPTRRNFGPSSPFFRPPSLPNLVTRSRVNRQCPAPSVTILPFNPIPAAIARAALARVAKLRMLLVEPQSTVIDVGWHPTMHTAGYATIKASTATPCATTRQNTIPATGNTMKA